MYLLNPAAGFKVREFTTKLVSPTTQRLAYYSLFPCNGCVLCGQGNMKMFSNFRDNGNSRASKIAALFPELQNMNYRNKSATVVDVIIQMLEPRAPVRLRGDMMEQHPFFASTGENWWPKIKAQQLKAPWVPTTSDAFDCRHFPDDFGSTQGFFAEKI